MLIISRMYHYNQLTCPLCLSFFHKSDTYIEFYLLYFLRDWIDFQIKFYNEEKKSSLLSFISLGHCRLSFSMRKKRKLFYSISMLHEEKGRKRKKWEEQEGKLNEMNWKIIILKIANQKAGKCSSICCLQRERATER
jgi:hypothetical protein